MLIKPNITEIRNASLRNTTIEVKFLEFFKEELIKP